MNNNNNVDYNVDYKIIINNNENILSSITAISDSKKPHGYVNTKP